MLIPVSNFMWGPSLAVRPFFANVAIISRTTIEIFNEITNSAKSRNMLPLRDSKLPLDNYKVEILYCV